MTAIHPPRTLSAATRFERVLLQASAALDGFVASRLERRVAGTRSAISRQVAAADARADALALGSIGILPR